MTTTGNAVAKPRKRRPAIAEKTRLRIKTSKVIDRLQQHVQGQCDMSATQIRAAEILLRKTLPDLQSVSIQANEGEVKFVISSDPIQSEDEWEDQFCGETIEGESKREKKDDKTPLPEAKVIQWVRNRSESESPTQTE